MSDNQAIAFLCHPYHRGGVTRWMADAARDLGNGREVYFITVKPAGFFFPAQRRELLLQLLGTDIAIRVIKANVGSEFEFGTQAYRAYIYRQLMLKLPLGTPVILSDDAAIWEAATYLNDSYPVIGVLHADEAHYYDLAKRYYRQIHTLVCVSERISRTVRNQIPEFDPGRVFTIPCGIHLPAVDFSVRSNSKLQLVYAGRLSNYQKRVSDVAAICIELAKNNVEFHINIIGDGDGLPELKHKFKEAGLHHAVTFCGWLQQKEVTAYLSMSDILILTSDFEGTPLAMMEALAAGCGFTGTRVSGIEDYEHHPLAADCLSVYTVGDIEDAVGKIKKIMAIPADIRKRAARQIAESEFSMATCLQKYTNVIAAIKPAVIPAKEVKLSLYELLYSKTIAAARYLKVKLVSR